MATEIMLKNVRLSFPHLFTATQYNGEGDFKFRAVFLISKDDAANMKTVKDAIAKEAKELWKEKAAIVLKGIETNVQKMCFQDGDIQKPDIDGYAGCYYIGASNKMRPKLVDADGKTPVAEADSKLLSGYYVNAIVDVKAYAGKGNGVAAYLKGVQFVKRGDVLGGGAPLRDDAFPVLEDTSEDFGF